VWLVPRSSVAWPGDERWKTKPQNLKVGIHGLFDCLLIVAQEKSIDSTTEGIKKAVKSERASRRPAICESEAFY